MLAFGLPLGRLYTNARRPGAAESGAAASGSGRAGVRQTYRRHEVLITRISGVIFIGFAVNALAHAAAGFARRRAENGKEDQTWVNPPSTTSSVPVT